MNPLTSCHAVEVKTRVYLPQHLSKPHGGKGSLISSIKDGSAVQNRWTSLIGAIDEDYAQELLSTIIELGGRGSLSQLPDLRTIRKPQKSQSKSPNDCENQRIQR